MLFPCKFSHDAYKFRRADVAEQGGIRAAEHMRWRSEKVDGRARIPNPLHVAKRQDSTNTTMSFPQDANGAYRARMRGRVRKRSVLESLTNVAHIHAFDATRVQPAH